MAFRRARNRQSVRYDRRRSAGQEADGSWKKAAGAPSTGIPLSAVCGPDSSFVRSIITGRTDRGVFKTLNTQTSELIGLDRALEYGAPPFRMLHGGDGAAEKFCSQHRITPGHANFPAVGAWILEQETRSPVRQVPHSSKRHFTHGKRPAIRLSRCGLYHRMGSLAASHAVIPPATSLTCENECRCSRLAAIDER
jgi:hypothetical protein